VPVANGAASLRFTSDNKGRRSGFVASYVVLAAAACASDVDCTSSAGGTACDAETGACVCALGWAGLACDSPSCLTMNPWTGSSGNAIASNASSAALPFNADCAWMIDATADGAVATGVRLVLSTFELEADSPGDALTVTRTVGGAALLTLTSTAASATPMTSNEEFMTTCDGGACSLELAGETAVTLTLTTDANDDGAALSGVVGVWYAVFACPGAADTGSHDCGLNGGTCSNGGCYDADGAATDCVCDWDETCAAGQYWDVARAECADCAAGTFEATAGVRYGCADCAAGKYAKYEGMDHCVTCPAEAYQPLEGADSCETCPDGALRVAQVQTASGDLVPVLGVSVAQCECAAGYYRLDGATGRACARCPSGATCAGNRSVPYPGEGYWTNTRSAAFLGSHYACPIPELCDGLWHLRSCFASPEAFWNCDETSINYDADDAGYRRLAKAGEDRRRLASGHQLFNTQMCSSGNLGTFCGVCEQGYYKGTGNAGCVACDGQVGLTLGVFFGLGFAVVASAAWLRWRIQHAIAGTMPPLAPHLYALFQRAYHALYDTGRFKIVWSTYQIISMINDNLDMEWPGAFGSFERLLGFSQLSLTTGILPVACFNPNFNYFDNLSSTLAWPLLALLANWLVMAPEGGVASGPKYERFETIKLMILYVVLPTTSLAIFQLFVCTEALDDGTSFLKADLSIQCNTPQYKAYATLAGVGIIVYPIGIPLYFLYQLGVWGFDPCPTAGCCITFGNDRYSTLRAGKASADPKLRSRRLLYEAYIPERSPWYEFADSLRRILLTALVVFMGETSAQRAAAGCMVSLISLAFVREAAPYVTPSNNPLSVVAR
jgi:hypothetical protein